MEKKTVFETPVNRGFTFVNSTGPDTSMMDKGKDASQIKGDRIGGGKDDLSHSITSGRVPKGK